MADFNKLLAEHGGGGDGGGGGSRGGGRKRRNDDTQRINDVRRDGGKHKSVRYNNRHNNRDRRSNNDYRQNNSSSSDATRPWRHAWSTARLARVKGKYLVILAAGDDSLHDDDEWPWHAAPSKGDFDLCIVYYGSNPDKRDQYKSHAKFLFEQKGPKWQLVRSALKRVAWEDEYEYIWLPDDDLKMDPKLIKHMLDSSSAFGVLLGQPALFDVNVQRQYREILVKREGLLLHYTNFVEIMAPFMRCDALKYLFYTIDSDACKSGWGLDMLWPTLLGFCNVAVIDATPVLHTRPQNAFNVDNSFYRTYNIDPQRECHELMCKFRFRDYHKRRLGLEIKLEDDKKEEEKLNNKTTDAN